MKKLMILGAGSGQIDIISKARARGLYVIVVSPYGDYPGLKIADCTYDLDVRDEGAILAVAMKEKIDGIITDQTDMAMRTVAYVAEQMGLPGIGYECAKLFTDKSAMRRKSEELGLPTIKSAVTTTCAEAEAFLEKLGKPAIIKPVDNQGSRGIYKIESDSDLRKFYSKAQEFSKSKQVIIEQYIDGDEYEVNSIVINGEEHTLCCGDLTMFQLPGIFASMYRLYPSCRDAAEVKRLLQLNKDTIEGFGLVNGISHSEYRVDRDGTPYLIEAAARGGGAHVSSDIIALQTGFDTSEYLIDCALGISHGELTFDTEQCHCGTFSFYLPAGKVVAVEGVADAIDLPYIRGNDLAEIELGMITKPYSDKTGRYISVLVGDDRENLMEHFNEYRSLIKIKVMTEEGLKGPVWE